MLIEQTIFHNNPATKEAIITIETKKTIVVDGVRHEVDLFITVDYGIAGKEIYIFECKNWVKGVGKYAVAQARKDEKIELLVASTELDTLPPLITTFHFVYDTISGGDIAARSTQSVFQKVGTRTFSNGSKVMFKGEELLLSEFKERILKSVESEVMSYVPTGTFSEGVYKYDRTQTLTYQPEELYIDGVEILELDVQAILGSTNFSSEDCIYV